MLGGDTGRDWSDGGGGISPTIIVAPKTVSNSNTPGGVIDFAFREGWMFPTRADVTDNIVLTAEDRGGVVTAPSVLGALSDLPNMVDDDGATAFERKERDGRPARALGVILQFDLGARFGVSRIRFFPRNAAADYASPDTPFQDDFLKAYEILLNDGTEETTSAGLPVFSSVLLETQNDEAVVDVSIEPQYVRYLQLKSQTTVGFEVAEFQVFGEGFVPTALFQSDVFDMSTDLAVFGNLRWQQDAIGDPGRATLEISTRTGLDDSPVVFHRVRDDGSEVPWRASDDLDDGSEAQQIVDGLDVPSLELRDALAQFRSLTLEQRGAIALTQGDYAGLSASKRGSVRDDLENWSTWSPPYSRQAVVSGEQVTAGEGGVPIASPGPRRYLQVRANYTSGELFSAGGLGSLSFDYTTPALAEAIVAEIQPRQAELGVGTPFQLTVVPDMRPGVDTGFGGVIVHTPVRVLSIDRIRLQQPDGSVREALFTAADLASLPAQSNDIRIEAAEEEQFRISFPFIEASRPADGTPAVLQVDFESVVLRTGTEFAVQAVVSEDEVPQSAVAGNADELSQGATRVRLNPSNLAVQIARRGNLLVNVAADPPALTPNGDNVNDETQIRFDIAELIGGADVTVEVRDLAGRLWRVVADETLASGRYVRSWDGTDSQGGLVPPGLYLYSIRVDADARSTRTAGTVAVAY